MKETFSRNKMTFFQTKFILLKPFMTKGQWQIKSSNMNQFSNHYELIFPDNFI